LKTIHFNLFTHTKQFGQCEVKSSVRANLTMFLYPRAIFSLKCPNTIWQIIKTIFGSISNNAICLAN